MKQKIEEKKIFSIDIDGVIGVATAVDDWDYSKIEKHKVYPETIKKINQLYDDGHTIILHTGRKKCNRTFTKKWLNLNGVKFHELVMGKPQADFYVDDRAIVGRESTIKSFIKWEDDEK